MNKTHLHNILTQYIERYGELDDKNGNNEGYKWTAVSCFKENFDINADDFAAMFKKATEKTSNLINNGQVQPTNGIMILADKYDEAEFVKECFRELFAEDGGNLDARQQKIEEFIEKINSCISRHISGSWKYHQNMSAVICYLNLYRPEENYLYKATVAKEWANCTEFGENFGSGSSFNLASYYRMCDELLDVLKENSVIMELYRERMKSFDGIDDKGHLLVYDVIYCAKAYNLYKNVPSFVKISTKQRLLLAENAQKKEHLLERYASVYSELEFLEAKLTLPDLTGENVTHKMWGKGVVTLCENASIEIDFACGKKRMIYPDCIGTFVFPENRQYIEFFGELKENMKEKKALEAELASITKELDNIKG